jgi:hypothetical protein
VAWRNVFRISWCSGQMTRTAFQHIGLLHVATRKGFVGDSLSGWEKRYLFFIITSIACKLIEHSKSDQGSYGITVPYQWGRRSRILFRRYANSNAKTLCKKGE